MMKLIVKVWGGDEGDEDESITFVMNIWPDWAEDTSLLYTLACGMLYKQGFSIEDNSEWEWFIE